MPSPHQIVIIGLLILWTALASPQALCAENDGPVYELRVYTCAPGKLSALHERFRNHTLGRFSEVLLACGQRGLFLGL